MKKEKHPIITPRKLLAQFEPADIIAFLVIAGVLFLNWRGIQTMLSSAVLVIIGYYFSSKVHKNRR